MLYQQIPALFYSLSPRFKDSESVRITHSQYEQMNDLVLRYCYSHDEPRLKSLMRRVHRRMDQQALHHLWHTEFDYITSHLMKAMKEASYCRSDDSSDSVMGVLNRVKSEDEQSRKRYGRQSDHLQFSQSVKHIFDRWLH